MKEISSSWVVVGASFVAMGGVLPVFVTGGLSVQLRSSLSFGEAQLGVAVAAFFCTAAIFSVALGGLVEKMGARKSLLISALLSSCVLLVMALVVHSWEELVLALIIGGVANGMAQPSANLYLAKGVPRNRQGLAFGLKQGAMPMATLIGGASVPLVALTIGWRWAFGLAVLLPLLGGASVLASRRGTIYSRVRSVSTRSARWISTRRAQSLSFSKSSTESASSVHEPWRVVRTEQMEDTSLKISKGLDDRSSLHRTNDKERGVDSGLDEQLESYERALPNRSSRFPYGVFAALAIGAALGVSASNCLGAYTVSTAVESGFSPGIAGAVAAGGSGVCVASRLLVGIRADQRSSRHLVVVATMLALGAVGFLGLATTVPWLVVLGEILAFGLGWGWNGLFNYSVVRLYPAAPGKATGVTQTGVYAGAALGPLGFGFLLEHTSYSLAWSVTAGVAIIGATAMLIARRLAMRSSLGR